jgi:hypothetical protein
MLVIAKRSMLFREQVAGEGDVTTSVKKPWLVHLKVGMSPQEAPDWLAEDPAFVHAVAAGAVVLLNPPKLAA